MSFELSTEAVAIIGFVVLFVLMLLARAGRHGDGFGRRLGLCLSERRRAGAEDRRPHLDADGDRLEFRGDPDVPADGIVRHHVGHEPRAVPRRQRLPRPSARRARHRHHRGLRRLRRDLRLVGRDRGDVLARRLSGDAALRLSAVVRDRRDRGRRHARHHDPAFDGVRGLWADHRAGRRQAVHRRHRPGHPRGRHVHGHDHRDRPDPAGLPAGGPTRTLVRKTRGDEGYLGDAVAVRLRHRRHLRRAVHRDRGRRHGRRRRLHHRRRAPAGCRSPTSAARCSKPPAPPPRCSPC